MFVTITVTLELTHLSGKFATRDELVEQVVEAIEGANPDSLTGGADGDSEYEVASWDVEEVPQRRARR